MRISGLAQPPSSLRRASKSSEAFRTISEVADDLEVPQHVLRFWESKFPQIKPLKRAGGRRYYRPDDVGLLRRIRQCLYEQGYTIKGVQKLLREGALKTEESARPSAPPAAATARTPVAERPSMPENLRPESLRAENLREVLADCRDELLELREMLLKARD